MTRPWDVIGIGATSVDYVYRLPVRPEADGPHSKIRISSHTVSCGGQMATALAACAALGLRSKFAGVLGSDDNGTRVQRGARAPRRRRRRCRRPSRAEPVRRHPRRRTHRGADGALEPRRQPSRCAPDELPPELLSSARIVHVDDVDQQAAIRSATLARAAGAIVTSDIDRVTDRTEELVAAVSIPILAEHVPAAMTGEPEIGRALRKLHARHGTMMCVTLGRSGAMIVDGGRRRTTRPRLPSMPSIRPAPATSFAARSSTVCCAATSRRPSSASPTPPPP